MHQCLGNNCRYLGIDFLYGFCSRCYIKFVESLPSIHCSPPIHPFPRLIPKPISESKPNHEGVSHSRKPSSDPPESQIDVPVSQIKTIEEWKKWALHNSELQTSPTKCWKCSRKIGLVVIKCRCGFIYCDRHRPPYKHECGWNYRETMELPTIISDRNFSDRID